jgi:hypothetical protein
MSRRSTRLCLRLRLQSSHSNIHSPETAPIPNSSRGLSPQFHYNVFHLTIAIGYWIMSLWPRELSGAVSVLPGCTSSHCVFLFDPLPSSSMLVSSISCSLSLSCRSFVVRESSLNPHKPPLHSHVHASSLPVLSLQCRPTDVNLLRGSYAGISTAGFRDFLLKPELMQAIADAGFEHPSEGS